MGLTPGETVVADESRLSFTVSLRLIMIFGSQLWATNGKDHCVQFLKHAPAKDDHLVSYYTATPSCAVSPPKDLKFLVVNLSNVCGVLRATSQDSINRNLHNVHQYRGRTQKTEARCRPRRATVIGCFR